MRRLAIFAGAFAAGVFLAQYLLPEGWLLPGAGLCFLLACASMALPWEVRRRALVICAALALALGYDWLYVRQIQRPVEALAETERMIAATVLDYPSAASFGARVMIRMEGVPGKVVLYGAPMDLAPGQTISGMVTLRSAAQVRDEDITTFTSKGVFLLAYSRKDLTVEAGTMDSPRWYPLRLGKAMQDRIAMLLEGDTAAFLTAILTGDRTGLSEEAASNISEAGLSHILAVSGMHCGILMGLISLFTGKRRQGLRALCAIPLLCFYAVLTGCSPSVLRACVMLGLLLLGPVFGRENDGPTSLLAALLLILLANPFAAASVSLQLSFAAMAGLLWLTPKISTWATLGWKKARKKKAFRVIVLSLSATAGALVFTVPLCAWYFGTLSLVTPLSSLLCLEAAVLAFGLGLGAAVLGLFCLPLGKVLALPAGLLARYILGAADVLAGLPGHALYFNNPYLKYWLLYAYVLFTAAYLLKKAGPRKYVLAGGLAILTLALTACLGAARYHADLDVVVLDVGQGQSVILASSGVFTLVDCGSSNSWYDPGEIAARQLLTMGCRRLDRLVLTHYDSDHVNGVTALLARIQTDTLLVPDSEDSAGLRTVVLEAAAAHGTEVVFVEDVTKEAFGKGVLTIFPPLGDGEDNEEGLTILASAGEADFLITGDMDTQTEQKLLETYGLPDIEGMMAGHHGSKYATSQEILEALDPEEVCISVGSNSYGHPTEELLTRLAGRSVWRTDQQGSIHLSWNQEE